MRDSDADGLVDEAEVIVGTDPNKFSTVGDGISDGAKLAGGLDPLAGRAFPTGVIASLPLQGEAKEVVAIGSTLDPQGQTAYVATGSHGLAIVNASQFQKPIVLGQLDLPGDATDVSLDPNLRIAAVATNAGGLQFVDVSDPTSPRLLRTINVPASQVEVVDGLAYVAIGAYLRSYDLLTGEEEQMLALPGSALTGLAREGTFLYTMDAGRTLRVIDISGGSMVLRGGLTLPAGGGKLFVGNGIAYVGAGGGVATVNVSDPNNLQLLSGVDAANIVGTSVVANGSGLAIAVGSFVNPVTSTFAVDVLNVADPTNTGDFLTRINLPVAPSSVVLAAGIAFVADGTGGLQVVNYLPFDNRGQAPTVTISSPVQDLDPNTPGIQVTQGRSIPIRADVRDDVQVRNVELLVNGQVVRNDVSFPFDFSAVALGTDPNATTMTVQVRTTDTGGNTTLSNVLTFDLVQDTVAPTVVSTTPANGSTQPLGLQRVEVIFSEPLAASTVTADNFQLRNASGAIITPLNIQLRNDDRIVQLVYDPLPEDAYQLVIDGPAVTDRAGNALSTGDVVTSFSVVNLNSWTNASGGAWENPANWSLGHLPGPQDHVAITLTGTYEITINSDVSVASLTLGSDFGTQTLSTSHNLTLGGRSTITRSGFLNQTGGTLTSGSRLDVNGRLTTTNIISNGLLTVGATGNVALTNGMLNGDVVSDGSIQVRGNLSSATGTWSNAPNSTLLFSSGSSYTLQAGANLTVGTVHLASSTMTLAGSAAIQDLTVQDHSSLTLSGTGTITSLTVGPNTNIGFDPNFVTVSGTITVQNAVINTTSHVTLTGSANASFQNLTISGNSSGLTSAANISVGNLTLGPESGLGGTGTVTVSGLLDWQGGTMDGTGRTVATGTLTIEGSTQKELSGGRRLENAGAGTWGGSGKLRMRGGAVFTNRAGGTLDVGDQRLDSDFSDVGESFANAGTLRKSTGTGTLLFSGVSFTNSGTIDIQTGTLELNGGGQVGTIQLAENAELALSGGSYAGQALLSGPVGALHISASTVTLAGTATITDLLVRNASSVTLAGHATITTLTVGPNSNSGLNSNFVTVSGTATVQNASLTDSSFTVTGGASVNFQTVTDRNSTLDSAADITIQSLTLAGLLRGSGNVTVTGLLNLTGGVWLDGSGRTIVNGTLAISGDGNKLLRRRVENMGTATWSGTGNFLVRDAGTFVNLAGATFDVLNDQSFIWDGFGPAVSFINDGTFRKAAGAGATTFNGVAFTNSGSVEVQTGTLAFAGGYTQTAGNTILNGGTLSASGTMNIQGGVLSGSGTINANVLNAGQVNPGGSAGSLTIVGTYTQTATGVLNIEIGGLTAGTQFDQLIVTGTATLNGTLNITLNGGFLPSLGDSFQIMRFGSRSGTFATVTGLDLGNGTIFDPSYNSTDLLLNVI